MDSCYNCHRTTLTVGTRKLASVEKGAVAERGWRFQSGQSYSVRVRHVVTRPEECATRDCNAFNYTALLTGVTNPPGFFVEDPQGILGANQPGNVKTDAQKQGRCTCRK